MARSSDATFPLSLIRDKAFEMRQIRRVLFLSVFFIVQSTLVLGFFYHSLLGDLVSGNAPVFFVSEDISALDDAIPSVGTVLKQWMLVMMLVNAVVAIAVAVYVFRRMGSPLLAMRRVLNEVGDGNLDARLRANDSQEFAELSDALNRALEQVHGKIRKAQDLTSIIDSLEDQPHPDEKTVVKAMIECREVLSFFKSAPSNDEDSNEDTSMRKAR